MRRLLLLLLLFPLVLQAQKVTLVMSGGGAKGLAHIGVLKALEEEGIPVNFIAGTSMGGVVAGCYAAGFSAAEIEGLVSSPAFIRWVNGEVEARYNYFFYSDDPTPSVLDVEFRLDSTMHASLASNLASDLSLNFALAEIFAQPSQIANYNFDSLYVPVRIMASDVFTQSEIVLKSGSLASAIRSTLSVPFFYQPIRFEGKYLFDGGIYNNFPVDVALSEFDSDVIIGVNVASKIFEEYPYDKDDELLNRSMLFMFLDKADPSAIPSDGIYIEPNLTGYTAFDFKKAKSLIDSGYVAAKRLMPEIMEKIPDRITPMERKRSREEFWAPNIPLSFSGIDYYGFNDHQEKYLNRLFKADRSEKSDFLEVKKSYFEMMSEPYLQSIYPDIHFDDETDNYRLELHDRPHSNLNLHLGGVIASRNISQVYLGADHFYFDRYLIRTSLNFYAGNFHKSAQLKSRFMLSNFYPVYIEPGVTFNTWDYLDNDDLFFKNQEATVVERVDRNYGLNIGFPITAKYKGVLYGSYFNNEDNYAGSGEVLPSDTLNYLQLTGLRAGFLICRDELNRRQYANDGIAMKASFDYFSVDENYVPGSTAETVEPKIASHNFFRVGASLEQYFRYGKYSTGYLVQGVFSNQPLFSDKEGSVINAPAFSPLTDSKTLILQNLVGFNYVAGGWRNVFTLSDLFEFRLEGYTFKSFDGMRAPDEQLPSSSRFDRGFKFAATAGFVMHSPFGPVSLSANYYDDEENQFGVLLHLGYLLFNRSSWE